MNKISLGESPGGRRIGTNLAWTEKDEILALKQSGQDGGFAAEKVVSRPNHFSSVVII